jgi:hypothetical protein
MYSASPRFSQQYQYLVRGECDQIRIISAKYGLIEPEKVIQPYNQKMEPSEADAGLIRERISLTGATKIISLLSGPYKRCLDGLEMEIEETPGGIYEKAKVLGKQGRLRRGPSFDWPMNWILETVFERKQIRVDELRQMLMFRNYAGPTVEAQTHRIKLCPLFIFDGASVQYKYA